MNLRHFENLLEEAGFEMVEDNTDAFLYGSRVFKRSHSTEGEIVTTNLLRKEEEK